MTCFPLVQGGGQTMEGDTVQYCIPQYNNILRNCTVDTGYRYVLYCTVQLPGSTIHQSLLVCTFSLWLRNNVFY
jgi:hypothetical protein